MPSVEYAHGVPIWIDLGTSDIEAAVRFYGGLFGWTAGESQPDTGGYRMFLLGGRMVAGVMPLMSPQQPVAWSTYICSDDADATTDAVRAADGTVVVEPMDVLDAGRMAMYQDTVGAYFGIWQPRQHRGAELANEPGAFCWNELATRDIEKAKAFYGRVFGWTGTTNPFGTTTYTEFRIGDRTIGGMREMGAEEPPQVPSHWLVYFAVADCDKAAGTVGQTGGKVLLPPMTIDPGRLSVVGDPQGGMFGIIALNQAGSGG